MNATASRPLRRSVGELAAVALERLAVVVELVPVELDDEVRVRPVGVDEVAVDEHVGLGGGETALAEQVAEEPLELGVALAVAAVRVVAGGGP